MAGWHGPRRAGDAGIIRGDEIEMALYFAGAQQIAY